MRREQGRHSDITHKKYFTNASIKNNPWFTDPFYMKSFEREDGCGGGKQYAISLRTRRRSCT
jgi:hypothetical protein